MIAPRSIAHVVDEIMPGVVADRRHLHAHPELGFQEHETAGFVAGRLRALGLHDIRAGVAGTGVTGLIRGGRSSPGLERVIMVRADMDALPIPEQNDVAYRSQRPGVMHACGHDAHTAMLLGLARVLVDVRDQFAGTVKVLFQPAEEIPPGGAIAMIRAGVLEDPHVDAALGLHVSSELPAGHIGIRAGAGSAAGDIFTIRLQGRGGHAASPRDAIDPVVAGAHLVMALQALVSREADPVQPAVVSVTAFQAGEAFNVIPDTVEVRGTVRALDASVREVLERRLLAVARHAGETFGVTASVEYTRGYPAIVNDPRLERIVRAAAIDAVGASRVIDERPTMGGEDFAYFSLVRPACFFNVGTRNDARGITWQHHHPRFDIEEEGMAPGILTMAGAVLGFLEQGLDAGAG